MRLKLAMLMAVLGTLAGFLAEGGGGYVP